MAAETAAAKQPRFFYGWWVVLVSFFGDFLAPGITTHSFSFLVKPMTQELGWTRTMIMLGTTVKTSISAFSGPMVGPLIDHFGARLVMVVSAALAGAGIMALSRVNALWQFYLFYGLAGAICLIGIGGLITTTAVAKWFIRKRGRALAIVTAGLPLGGAVLGPISQYIIVHFGWRLAWIFLGATLWIVMIPLAWFLIRRTPEDMGLLPDGEDASPEVSPRQNGGSGGIEHRLQATEEVWTLKEAFKTPTLWLIILAFNTSGVGLGATLLHQTAYLSDKGLPSAAMTSNMIVWGIAAAVGSLFWGILAEKFPVRYSVAGCFLLSAGGLAILIGAQSLLPVLVYAVVFGIGSGGFAPLYAITLANYYGRTFLGSIHGVSMPFRLVSIGGGPLFAAYIYDVTRSYNLAFSIFATTNFIGAFLILITRPPRRKVAAT